ncbi:MAG: DNA ligase D [Bryobacteraceae bacterium]|jgi:bifunctional non-homologous end joining protein LigD
MPLEEYAAKRRFEKTPEPGPAQGRDARFPPHYFCVQRHDATRLHYDFRLEIGGVLKSWAVPKGPTLDADVKHLAAQVEDHPIDYGDFEGTIPAGNYGAGSVMLWDRGTFDLLGDASADEQLARGDFKFYLHGEKLRGNFALVRMKGRGKGNEWLLLKKRDEFAIAGWDLEAQAHSALSGRTQEEIAQNLPARTSKRPTAGAADRVWESRPAGRAGPARKAAAPKPAAPRTKSGAPKRLNVSRIPGARAAAMPDVIEPMTAVLADHPPRGGDWLLEVKWDGVRAIAFVDHEELRLVSRNGIRSERQYPELAIVPHQIAARQAVLDGEIAALDEKGVARFHLIQPRITNADESAVARMAHAAPVVYFVFDLLYLDGYDLRGAALADRRALLEKVVTPGGVLRISEAFPAETGEALLEAARENGLEGVMAKRTASVYESRRSSDWQKIKLVHEQEFVIGGFTAPQGARSHFGALVLGVHEKESLQWVGNLGTGFDQRTLDDLAARLKPLETSVCPFSPRPSPDKTMTWVKPELVCQVKFANWTPDRRLRAPVYLGLRQDKPAGAVVRELVKDDAKEATVTVDGRTLKLTNLHKVYYPDEGYTKGDVLSYYSDVAGLILPHLKDRPLSLKRYPNGIRGEYFFQKRAGESFAPWLRTESIPSAHNQAPISYVFAEDRASLLYLVNLGCIDHNPWLSRSPHLDQPDFLLIDLDPQACSFDKIVEAALVVKRILDRIGLTGYPKTTGGDGMHIYVPVEPIYSFEETRNFADLIARLAAHQEPKLFTAPRTVAKRQNDRVYFDYLQNASSKTIAAPYVLRAYPGAPVATPLEWKEVGRGLHPLQFHLRNARQRFAEKGDLFAGVLQKPQPLEAALAKLEEIWK